MRVPTYDNTQVSQTGTDDVAVNAPNVQGAQSLIGNQLQDAGAAVQRAGNASSQIALSMQDMANQIRVNDATNKARQAAQDLAYNPQTGYLNLKGDAALTRPTGQDLTAEYGDKFSEQLGNIAEGLGNDAQRRLFQQHASDLSAQFHGQVETHLLGEFREHALSVQDGTINLASDDAKRNWSNPDLIGPSLNAAKAAVMQKGQLLGWSASARDAALLTTTSKVHTDVVMAALENNNPSYALSYLDGRRGEMTADDILRVQGHVNQSVWLNQSQGAVQAATAKSMPAIAPTNFDRMTQITLGAESGGNRYGPDGKTLLTSPKGAKGEMQVMDDTNTDPGFGVRPAMNAGPDERARVGRDYLQAMMQKYGDPAKAWAAYNAGPGALDKAMADSSADAQVGAYRGQGGQPVGDWLSRLPKATQAYVTANVAKLGSNGTPVAPRPTELDFVNTALGSLPPGAPPQVVQMTRAAAVSQFGVISKSMTETGDNATRAGRQWILGNVGTPIDQMPADIRDPIVRFAPENFGGIGGLESLSKAMQKGDVVTNNGRYNDIVGHMDQYAKMSDTAWGGLQTELDGATFRRLSKDRADYMTGKTTDTSENLNRAAVNRTLNQNLETLKIPTNVGKDADGAARLGGIRKFVDQSILDAQQGTGKKLTPGEIVDHINGLFSTSVDFKNTLWYGGTETGSQNLMSMQLKDLPDGAAPQLRQALVQNGNKAPSDADVLNLYRKLHAPH
jgi:soluble lytic murein transglycosylase